MMADSRQADAVAFTDARREAVEKTRADEASAAGGGAVGWRTGVR
jgi:hypothetical protein